MARVPAKNSTPEQRVRAALRVLGLPGYRLHRRDLPGSPDIAYIGRRWALFVHGCFWHGHPCKRGARVPKTNEDYWRAKIARNQARDAATRDSLEAMGYRVITIWECETRPDDALRQTLARRLGLASETKGPIRFDD